jgi:hypothetical protein
MALISDDLKQRLLSAAENIESVTSSAIARPVCAKLYLPDAPANWYLFHAEEIKDDLMLYGVTDIGGQDPNFFILALSDFEEMSGPMQCNIQCEEFKLLSFEHIVKERPERFANFLEG